MSTADAYVRARIDTATKERAADALQAYSAEPRVVCMAVPSVGLLRDPGVGRTGGKH